VVVIQTGGTQVALDGGGGGATGAVVGWTQVLVVTGFKMVQGQSEGQVSNQFVRVS
jgi:hypothetical protein